LRALLVVGIISFYAWTALPHGTAGVVGPAAGGKIDCGSLHPTLSTDPTAALSGHLLVRVNGETLLDADEPYDRCDPASFQIGQNPIGASTADAAFTGQVIESRFTGNALGTTAR
jgi:hypothetical protein